MQRVLAELDAKMRDIEAEELAPPGWKASWDRYAPITTLVPLLATPLLLLLLLPLLFDKQGKLGTICVPFVRTLLVNDRGPP